MADVLGTADDLLSTLLETKALLESLSVFAEEKAAALQAEDIAGLDGLLEKEEDVLLALGENEAERQAKALALARAADLAGADPSLEQIIEAVAEPERRAGLARARIGLTEETARLIRWNTRVRELLQTKINYTDYMINLLYTPADNGLSYDMQGNKEEESAESALLDFRV